VQAPSGSLVNQAFKATAELACAHSGRGGHAAWAGRVAEVMDQNGITLDLQSPQSLSEWELQLDGAQAHRTAAMQQYLAGASPSVLKDWPPCSSDLSCIENVRAWCQRKINDRPRAEMIEAFTEQVQHMWGSRKKGIQKC
jgi:hypothetical protein